MGRRTERERQRRRRQKQRAKIALVLGILLAVVGGCVAIFEWKKPMRTHQEVSSSSAAASSSEKKQESTQTARIMAHGDLLYHDALYMSAQQADGSYDFSTNFTYVKPWIEQADLAIADFEGTISSEFPLAGYPLFNAPASVATAIKDAGYDVVDLAHNHILDSQLSGLISTAKTFTDLGVGTVGVYPEEIGLLLRY